MFMTEWQERFLLIKSPETLYVTSGLSLVFAILSVTELHKAGIQLENAVDD